MFALEDLESERGGALVELCGAKAGNCRRHGRLSGWHRLGVGWCRRRLDRGDLGCDLEALPIDLDVQLPVGGNHCLHMGAELPDGAQRPSID